MTEPAWTRRPPPAVGSDADLLGRWELATLSELTRHRVDLAAALHDGARPADADEGAVEGLLLIFEELVSNALRHGRAPVCAEVTAFARFWLLDVSDAAVNRQPAPAVGRDPAHGGLGLHLVARLCGAYGWTVAENRKHVWARIDHTSPEAPAPVPRAQHG